MGNPENKDFEKTGNSSQPDPKSPGQQDEIITNADEDAGAEISDEELALLDFSDEGRDGAGLLRGELDKTDDDGEALNEVTNLSGDDLDVPGSEDDDDNEIIGAEDEENNLYSRPDNENAEDVI